VVFAKNQESAEEQKQTEWICYRVIKNCSVKLSWLTKYVCTTKDVKIVVLNGRQWKGNLQ
jgi:hypothetical protein